MSVRLEKALVLAFTYMAFILGTTEYIIVGLLPDLGSSLGVSLAAAGSLVSGFAIAYALGTPLVLAAVHNRSKRPTILVGLLLLALANMVSIWATSFHVLLLLRVVSAVLCGLCLSLVISFCSEAIDRARRGKAVSLIISGFAIANVLGVPIGTLVGHRYEWRAALVLVAALCLLALLLIAVLMPGGTLPVQSSLRDQFKLLTHPRIMLAFLIPFVGISSIFVVYTYITPILEQILHVPRGQVSLYLLLYGAVTIVSNIIGSRVASGNSMVRVAVMFLIMAGVYVFYGSTASVPGLGLAGLLLIALISYAINAATQLYLIDLTGRFLPEAKDFSASLMPIAANAGIAVGAFIGGLAVAYSGLNLLPWISAPLALIACALTVFSYRLDVLGSKQRIPEYEPK